MRALRIISFSLVLLLWGCYYDVEELLYPETDSCLTGEVSYQNDILPILSSKCNACHNQGSQISSINLEGYNALSIYIDNGRFEGAVNHTPGFSPMPQGGAKLAACELEKISSWIANGAPDN